MTENPQPRTLQKRWKFCTISKCIQNVLRKYFSAKLFVPLIKRSVSTIFKAIFWKIEFFTENPQPPPLQKWWKFCTISKCAKNFFLATLFVPLIKRSVSTTFKAVYGKLNCWQKINSRGPYKNGENFVLSQNVLRIFFWQHYLFHSSKEVFLQLLRQFMENWIVDRKSTAADLTKMVKILYYFKMCLENIFWQHYLFHSLKEAFLQTFRQFSENWIFDRKSTAADLTKKVKIFYYLKMYSKCTKKIFFSKIICSTYQKKLFYNL